MDIRIYPHCSSFHWIHANVDDSLAFLIIFCCVSFFKILTVLWCHFANSAYTPCAFVRFMNIPIVFMFLRRITTQSLLLLLFLTIPASSFGASFLPTDAAATVNRGDFLREAITQLAIPYTKNAKVSGLYTRPIPKALESYVSAGEKQNALIIFGKDLKLSTTITRGEAAALVVSLLQLKPTSTSMSFTDIKARSLMERGAGLWGP